MKKDIHPEYREVLFHDISVDEYFLLRSTLKTEKQRNGKEKNTHTILLKYLLHHILFILAKKKSLIPVEEFRNLKKGLARKNKANLYLNFQSP
ncbi:MAG: hypothetical protein Ct9H90mP22_0210 [Gammaproteobacteria bacterium]|nr:MAG: hypothetical protein Ct9H90mP22_0210 [Gammaproteobacteria bacterium]